MQRGGKKNVPRGEFSTLIFPGNMTKLIAFLASTIAILLTASLCCAQGRMLEVEAAKLEYIEQDGLIRAEGNVQLHFGNFAVYTPTLIIHVDTSWLETDGGVTLTAHGYEVEGIQLRYNLRTQEGTISDLHAKEQGVYFHGKEGKFSPKKTVITHASLTTCNLDPPHYSLNAEYVELYPGERLVLQNVTVYLFSIPVFWLPSYTYQFTGTEQIIAPEIGYDEFSGWFIKAGFPIPSSTNASAKLRLDYREKRGIATGLWLQKSDDTSSTTIQFYQTREKGTNRSRGMTRVRYIGPILNPTTLLRINIDQVSDKDFFPDYLPELDPSETTLLPSTLALDIYGQTSKLLIQAQGHINPTDTYPEFAPRLRLVSFVPTSLLRTLQVRGALEYTNFYTEEGQLSRVLSTTECSDSWLLGGQLTFKPTLGYELIAYQGGEGQPIADIIQRQTYELFLQVQGQAGHFSHAMFAQLGYYLQEAADIEPPEGGDSDIDLTEKNFFRLHLNNTFSWDNRSVLTAQAQLDYRCTGEPHNLGPLEASLRVPLYPGEVYFDLLHDFYGEEPWYTRWGLLADSKDTYLDLNYSNYSSGEEFISVDSRIRVHEGFHVHGKAIYDIAGNQLVHLSYGLEAILHCLGVRLSVQEKPQWSISGAIFIPTLATLSKS